MAQIDKEKLLTRKTTVSRFYQCWVNMKTRCNSPKYKDFKNYGGRGIKVCKKWDKFEGFIEDMFDSYEEGLTIDRIDNEKGYNKRNCRWVKRSEQNSNKQHTRYFTVNGITMMLKDWSKTLGINESTLSQRIYTYKWSPEKALTQRRANWHKLK